MSRLHPVLIATAEEDEDPDRLTGASEYVSDDDADASDDEQGQKAAHRTHTWQSRGHAEDEHDSDEEAGDDASSSAPRKPRRAEIDPATMSEDDREQLRVRVLAQVSDACVQCHGVVTIVQVEFYFGDPHYPKDAFMLEQAGRHLQGYIPVTVVMSFKKMRRMTQYPAFIASTMRASTVVEVSDDGLALRRRAPLPKDYEDALTRTVLLERLPAVCAQFQPFSEESSFISRGWMWRTCRPGARRTARWTRSASCAATTPILVGLAAIKIRTLITRHWQTTSTSTS